MNWATFMDSDYGSRYLLMNPKIRALQYYRSHDRFDSMTHVVPIQSDIILSQLGNPQDQDHTSRVVYFRVRCCRTSSPVVSFIMADVVELSIPKSNSKIPVYTGLFINNEFVPSVGDLDRIKYALCLDHS